MITVDGTLSASIPRRGRRRIVARVEARIIFWYNVLDSVSDAIRPSSTKLVIQRRRKVEKRIAIKRMIDAPMKQRIYLGSLLH